MNKKIILLLIGIILLGGLLRFYQLGSESVWLDEGYSLREAESPTLKSSLTSIKEKNNTPPTYFLFLKYWIKAFGKSEFLLRLPSAIFGTISILIIFFIGKEWFNEKTGLISSLILSVSMIHILYSQELRHYSLFTFATLLSILFYIQFLRQPDLKNQIFYILSTAFSFYIHYLAAFTIFSQIAIFYLFQKKFKLKPKKYLNSLIITALSFIPLVFILPFQALHLHKALQMILVTKLGFPNLISNFGILLFLSPIIFVIFLIFILKIFKFDFYSFYKKIKFNELSSTILILLLFAAFLFVYQQLTSSHFITRYSHFTFPLFYILFAKGFTLLDKKFFKYISAISFIMLALFSLTNYYLFPRNEQWSQAANFIESNSKATDFIVIIDADAQTPFDFYYQGNLSRVGIQTSADTAEIVTILEPLRKRDIWLILSHSHNNKKYNDLLARFHILDKEHHLKGIDIFHYT